MQLKFLLLISFTGITNAVFSQDANLFDARSLGLSGSNVTCSDSWSGIYNPAGLGLHSSLNISINYNNRFLLSELSTQTLISTVPTILGNISPSFRYFGSDQYNECNLVFAFGKMLAKWLSAGINFGYFMQTIEATDKRAFALEGQIGVIAIPLKGLKIGINIFNPTCSAYGRIKGEELASGLQAGISLSEEKNYYLAAQINYSGFEIFNYSIGAEYFITEYLSIRAGIKFPASPSFSFGLGMIYQRLSIDFGFEQHSILGLSSAIALSYTIK